MCGIAGVMSLSADYRVEPSARSTEMRETMVHRGPDGPGLWVDEDARIGFGFRRLAIIDLSHAADQPMANEDGSLRIVFNGEIYNHAEIRARARGARGHTLGHRPLRHRGHPPRLRGVGHRLPAPLPRHVRHRHLGRPRAGALAHPRPHRHQAALLRHPRRPHRLRLGDQGAAGRPATRRARSTRSRSSTTCRSSTTPGPADPLQGHPQAGRRHLAAHRRRTDRCASSAGGTSGTTPHPLTGVPEEEIAERLLAELRTAVQLPQGQRRAGRASSSPAASTRARTRRSSPRARRGRCAPSRSATRATTRATRTSSTGPAAWPSEVGADHHELLLTQDDLIDFLPQDGAAPGRAHRRPGLRAGLLRLQARARQRRHRRPGGRGGGRTLLRLSLVAALPGTAAAGRPARATARQAAGPVRDAGRREDGLPALRMARAAARSASPSSGAVPRRSPRRRRSGCCRHDSAQQFAGLTSWEALAPIRERFRGAGVGPVRPELDDLRRPEPCGSRSCCSCAWTR